jgi:hypothetical protein
MLLQAGTAKADFGQMAVFAGDAQEENILQGLIPSTGRFSNPHRATTPCVHVEERKSQAKWLWTKEKARNIVKIMEPVAPHSVFK